MLRFQKTDVPLLFIDIKLSFINLILCCGTQRAAKALVKLLSPYDFQNFSVSRLQVFFVHRAARRAFKQQFRHSPKYSLFAHTKFRWSISTTVFNYSQSATLAKIGPRKSIASGVCICACAWQRHIFMLISPRSHSKHYDFSLGQ